MSARGREKEEKRRTRLLMNGDKSGRRNDEKWTRGRK